METKINDFKVDVGCGRSATVTIEENCYIIIEFSNDNADMSPVDLSKHPELLAKAFSEIKKEYPDHEPKCLLYQSVDWVMYHFKRVL